jgi:hypothetical protein
MASKVIQSITKNTQTSRDRLLAEKRRAETAIKAATATSSIDQKVADLTTEVVVLDTSISQKTLALQSLITSGASQGAINAALIDLSTTKDTRLAISEQLTAAQIQSVNAKSTQSAAGTIAVASAAARVTTLASGTYQGSSSQITGSLLYNASAVKEAYFSNKTNFTGRVQGPFNQPSAVSAASQLWASSTGSKGMIVTSEQVLKAWNSGSNKPQSANYFDNHNYGFQFQYNPGTVGMSYFTAPNVDVAMMTSGTEMFNLAGVSGSQGSVSFQIVINRIFDMQYYTSSGAFKPGVSDTDIYPVRPNNTSDYLDIYNKGTMYDVEYLLRVLMGTTMTSYLRGTKTADMGWLPAIPVELHLGKSLRYLGTINSLNINHVIFDSRMVPLFTTMDIAFARLPDYPPAGTTATS